MQPIDPWLDNLIRAHDIRARERAQRHAAPPGHRRSIRRRLGESLIRLGERLAEGSPASAAWSR